MPRIPDSVISGVFYLYSSRDDALAGRNPGGTGFIVRYDGTWGRLPSHGNHFYGVTNWHVACSRGFSVIRLNTKDGGTDVIELGPEDWHFLPGKYDIAVVPLALDHEIHDVSQVSTHQFLRHPDEPGIGHIGVGDDVFMIGLFIDHDGMSVNVPSARFGNISMLSNPKATIKQSTGYMGESFVADMHSRTGFSGSPVYVYRTVGGDLGNDFFGYEFERLQMRSDFGDSFRGSVVFRGLFRLLGIHWGQFPEKWELHERPAQLSESRRDLIVEGGYVEGMSGMTCVIPAWHIMEVLDMPTLKDLRQPETIRAEKEYARQFPGAAKPEAAEPPAPLANDANPTHREDFMRLVGAAARKPAQED